MALAGPAANGVVCLVGWAVLPHVRGDVSGLLLGAVAWTNGFVALFNLLPGLPLDGGFLIDSLVWRLTGRQADRQPEPLVAAELDPSARPGRAAQEKSRNEQSSVPSTGYSPPIAATCDL